MQDAFPTVAVLMGGPSNEHAISLKTGEAVASALRSAGCTVHPIIFDDETLPPIPPSCEVVFPALHGFFGEDGQIQAQLEKSKMPFVGCDSAASRTIIDKAAFKQTIKAVAATSPAGMTVTDPNAPFPQTLKLPIVVKPNREGSTIGLTLVREERQWLDALHQALACDATVLVEEFIEGTECTVPVLDGQALPIVEIIPPGGLFDNDAKYAQTKGETIYNCPPQNISKEKQVEAALLAERIYSTVSARDMLRIDVIIHKETEELYVLEGNSLPGFTATSLMPKSAAAAGISFENLCLRLVRNAHRRGQL